MTPLLAFQWLCVVFWGVACLVAVAGLASCIDRPSWLPPRKPKNPKL